MKIIPLFLLLAFPCFAQTPSCVLAPSGLVGWWRGDGDASDSAGTNNGVLVNGASFAAGEVGQAFSFAGPNESVQVPDAPALDPTNRLSVEAWVQLSSYPGIDGVLVVYKNVEGIEPSQYGIAIYQTGSNSVFQVYVGVVPSGDNVIFGTTSLQTNTWYHVAITYDASELRLYVNGQIENSVAITGAVVVTTGPLSIGGYGFGPWNLPGKVDEVSLYNRALTRAEVQAIYSAGASGKCYGPQIIQQPQGQVGYWGGSVTFSVAALGSSPLNYLWSKDGFPIAWATNSSLTLTNLALDAGGNYSVLVSNPAGSIVSSNAFLTVNPAGVSLGLYPGLTLQGTPGNNYGIQYTTNVGANATWLTLTQLTLIQPIQLWIDSDNNVTTPGNTKRFYRVVAVP